MTCAPSDFLAARDSLRRMLGPQAAGVFLVSSETQRARIRDAVSFLFSKEVPDSIGSRLHVDLHPGGGPLVPWLVLPGDEFKRILEPDLRQSYLRGLLSFEFLDGGFNGLLLLAAAAYAGVPISEPASAVPYWCVWTASFAMNALLHLRSRLRKTRAEIRFDLGASAHETLDSLVEVESNIGG